MSTPAPAPSPRPQAQVKRARGASIDHVAGLLPAAARSATGTSATGASGGSGIGHGGGFGKPPSMRGKPPAADDSDSGETCTRRDKRLCGAKRGQKPSVPAHSSRTHTQPEPQLNDEEDLATKIKKYETARAAGQVTNFVRSMVGNPLLLCRIVEALALGSRKACRGLRKHVKDIKLLSSFEARCTFPCVVCCNRQDTTAFTCFEPTEPGPLCLRAQRCKRHATAWCLTARTSATCLTGAD